jgi:hypothetical protein
VTQSTVTVATMLAEYVLKRPPLCSVPTSTVHDPFGERRVHIRRP